MSLIKGNFKNNQKLETNKYFPYEPYPQQIKLMNFLIKALLNTKDIENTEKNYPKVILIESPTGTGKTMMLLSSLLEFLDQSKNNDNKNKETDNSNNEDEEDWLKNFGKNEESELEGKKEEEDRIKKVNEKMDLILSNIKKKINKKNNEELKLDKEDKKMLIKNKEKASNPFLTFLNKANNASNNIPNQIFFCTRTHSQISQIISESKKIYEYYNKNISKFSSKNFPFSFSFLGSRKQ